MIRVESNSWKRPPTSIRWIPRCPKTIWNAFNWGWITWPSSMPTGSLPVPPSPSRPACRRRHFRVTERARAAEKRIILPEGDEPRTIRAAALCAQRNIARCVLLGNPEGNPTGRCRVGVELPKNLEILDPSLVRANCVGPLVEMRKHKGLTPDDAAELLKDNVWLGTVMLAQGEVDGLVSGAVHSTANTIRPALQIIKTKPGAKVVSSIFFMCLPEQVLYGDCAVNPDPDAETLADIAIQSADSADVWACAGARSAIQPASRSGADVDKVREATRIAKGKRPDFFSMGRSS